MTYNGFIYGHTHYPLFYKEINKFIFNPGSLGDCRTNRNLLTFSLFDPNEEIFEIFGIKFRDNAPTEIISEPELIDSHSIKDI